MERNELPEGWKRVSIEKDSILFSGLRPKGGALDEGIPSLGGEHITPDGRVNFSDENAKYIPEKFFRLMTKGKAEKWDILINKDGANTGKVAILKEKFYPDIAINEHLFILRSKEFFEQRYLFYWMLSHLGQKQIKDRITGSAQPGLSSSFTKNFFVLKPPLPEQQKIAEILETVDRAIEKTEKIIEKYKRIKQGLMQDLLTKGVVIEGESWRLRNEKTDKFKDSPIGKIPEEWNVVRLGEILEYEQPQKYIVMSENYDSYHGIPVLTPGKTFILGYTDESFNIFKETPVIIFDDFTTESRYVTFPFKLKSSAIKILKLKKQDNNLYFFYNMLQILNYKPGSEHKRFWISEYSNLPIPLPPLPEQQKIAEILSQIDEVINKEEKHKEKLEHVKIGLMEDLLTGKVRVNNLIKEY